jgi:hypothetical protein
MLLTEPIGSTNTLVSHATEEKPLFYYDINNPVFGVDRGI